MCGICGIWGTPDPERTNKMVLTMWHRGPDDSGIFFDERVSLGMARLAVIDLNPTGHQPMSNPEQTIWIVYNGEIYNFREERSCLEKLGYNFKSTSDTEVIIRMYEHYGDDFLLRLRGMFALAIYDKRKGAGYERLFLARDHLGIKPLLYFERGSTFTFASELKPLLASGSQLNRSLIVTLPASTVRHAPGCAGHRVPAAVRVRATPPASVLPRIRVPAATTRSVPP